MPTLLHIDASPRGDRSVSRELTRDFAGAWKEANPDGQIIYRDLGHNPVPLVTETFIAAVYTPPEMRSPELLAAISTSDQLISELQTATDYVFGVPMYNFPYRLDLRLTSTRSLSRAGPMPTPVTGRVPVLVC